MVEKHLSKHFVMNEITAFVSMHCYCQSTIGSGITGWFVLHLARLVQGLQAHFTGWLAGLFRIRGNSWTSLHKENILKKT